MRAAGRGRARQVRRHGLRPAARATRQHRRLGRQPLHPARRTRHGPPRADEPRPQPHHDARHAPPAAGARGAGSALGAGDHGGAHQLRLPALQVVLPLGLSDHALALARHPRHRVRRQRLRPHLLEARDGGAASRARGHTRSRLRRRLRHHPLQGAAAAARRRRLRLGPRHRRPQYPHDHPRRQPRRRQHRLAGHPPPPHARPLHTRRRGQHPAHALRHGRARRGSGRHGARRVLRAQADGHRQRVRAQPDGGQGAGDRGRVWVRRVRGSV
mmetsp:Transcript_18880/g.40678  ORF Transcript_18880/g.40678 Transcript_18880/m.40678 type:complete len:271 (+) Transcript_18880:2144-2956(+)